MIKGSLFAMYVFYCICSICHTEPPDLISQNNFRFIYFSSFHPQFHTRGSKKPTFEIQWVPYPIPFHWSREAQNSFCFCSSSSGRPPLALFCFNGNYNGKTAKNLFSAIKSSRSVLQPSSYHC